MKKTDYSTTCHPSLKATNVLKAISDSANHIRKRLLVLKSKGQRDWTGLDDAIKLAALIENISQKAINLSAEDANSSIDLLEIMFEQLNQNVSRILTS